MIPSTFIQAWRKTAPWTDSRQVEQALIICRALCDLFSSSKLSGKIAFRGGTAINKLLFEKPQQWSSKGELLIPIQDIDGHFLGGQSIDINGRKSFPRGGRLNGGHYVIGALEAEKKVLIAEGYATAATLHEATALPVIVAFHSGNLLTVAQAYREKFQDKILVIAGDNDHTQPTEKNIGRQKAEDAAKKTGGYLLLPEFETGSPGSDWNDVANLKGLDAVKFALTVGLKEIDRKTMAAEQALHANIQKQKQNKQLAEHPSSEKDLVQASGGMTFDFSHASKPNLPRSC